jgi:hypothetical protein
MDRARWDDEKGEMGKEIKFRQQGFWSRSLFKSSVKCCDNRCALLWGYILFVHSDASLQAGSPSSLVAKQTIRFR